MLPIFSVLRDLGRLDDQDMYHTFNMGIGLIMVVSAEEVDRVFNVLKHFSKVKCFEIGQVVAGRRQVKLSL